MGMFDRDPNFEDHYKLGDKFTLLAIEYTGEIQTEHGTALRSRFQIETREGPKWFGALGSGFAEQARTVDKGDLPAQVEYVTVPLSGGRSVKRLAPVEQF